MTIIVLFLKLTFLYKIVVYIECLVGFMSINTIIDEGEIEFVSSYFFQLGTYAKVIEPQEIVNNIKQKAHSVINHYI